MQGSECKHGRKLPRVCLNIVHTRGYATPENDVQLYVGHRLCTCWEQQMGLFAGFMGWPVILAAAFLMFNIIGQV